MHWTTHVITGGALGCVIRRPVAATVAGICSHLVFDVLPHRDPESDVGYVFDTVLGLTALSAIAAARLLTDLPDLDSAIWGAVGAALPDVELVVKHAMELEDEQLLFPTHNGMLPHHQTGAWPSLLSQAALCALLLAPVAFKMRNAKLREARARGGCGG